MGMYFQILEVRMSEIPKIKCPRCGTDMHYAGGPSDSNLFTMVCPGCGHQSTHYCGSKYEQEQERALKISENLGAVISGEHIVYTSGKHGSTYFEKRIIYSHVAVVSEFCRAIAIRFWMKNIQVVVAPEVGGIALSQWVAHHLQEITGYEALALFAEKQPLSRKEFFLRGEYGRLIDGKNVLVLDDVLNTGETAKKVVGVSRGAGGKVVGVGALCNRGRLLAHDLDVPCLESLIYLPMDSWDEADCPLCKEGVAINTEFGKGAEFLAGRSG